MVLKTSTVWNFQHVYIQPFTNGLYVFTYLYIYRLSVFPKKLDYSFNYVLNKRLQKWLFPSSTARKVRSFLSCTCSGVAIHTKFTDYTHSKRMLVETRITFTVPSVSILNPGLEARGFLGAGSSPLE